jgi:hypothetical protein
MGDRRGQCRGSKLATQSMYSIYKEYQSICPLVGIGTLSPPLSPASVPLFPEPGGAHSPAGEGLGESQFRRLEKKLTMHSAYSVGSSMLRYSIEIWSNQFGLAYSLFTYIMVWGGGGGESVAKFAPLHCQCFPVRWIPIPPYAEGSFFVPSPCWRLDNNTSTLGSKISVSINSNTIF